MQQPWGTYLSFEVSHGWPGFIAQMVTLHRFFYARNRFGLPAAVLSLLARLILSAGYVGRRPNIDQRERGAMSERAVNRILLSGFLVSESELRELPDGKPVCWFRLASGTCSGQFGYFDVIVLGPSVPGYLPKGQGVLVQGSLESARWEEGEGTESEAVAVLAEHVDLVGVR